MNKTAHTKRILYISFTILLFIIVAAMFLTVMFERGRTTHEETLNELKTESWNYITGVISETYQQSEFLVKSIANEIVDDIYQEFDNDIDEIKHQLDTTYSNHSDNSLSFEPTRLEGIIGMNITDIYLKNITLNNMDPFVIMKSYKSTNILEIGFILSDLSTDCLSFGESRSFIDEISGQHDKKLAEAALIKIVTQNVPDPIGLSRVLGWQFTVPVKPEYHIDNFSMEELKKLYFKYNLDYRVLRSFEFLIPAYIDWRGDIAVRPTILSGNINPDAIQLIVVQGFGISDVIDRNVIHVKNLSYYKSKVSLEKERWTNVLVTQSLSMAVLVIMFILVVVSTSNFYNDYIIVSNDEDEPTDATL